METLRYLKFLAVWWWLIAASTLVAAGTSYYTTSQSPRIYQSRTTMLVGQSLRSSNPDYYNFYTSEALAKSYADIAAREPVLQGALTALKLPWRWEALKAMVNAKPVAGTQLIEVAVVDTDPVRAQALAAELANQLIKQGPSGADSELGDQRRFAVEQTVKLKANIEKADAEILALDEAISKSNSARQIQDARARQDTLRSQVSSWQATYAQMLASVDAGAPNQISIVERAQTPTSPIGPNVATNVLLASLIGLALGVGAAFLLDFLDDTVKTPDDVTEDFRRPVLGTIPRIGKITDPYPARLAVMKEGSSAAVEAFRVLRTNLQFASVDTPARSFMVTSSKPLEGKSVVTANIALSIAQTGRTVILVDADMRRPRQNRVFEVPNDIGLSTVLGNPAAKVEDYIVQSRQDPNLRILPAGPPPPNPPELLASKRMASLVDQLATMADIVVYDALPIAELADAASLGENMDGALFVMRSRRTRRGTARRAIEALTRSNIRILGVVLNGVPLSRSDSYYHYYRAYTDDVKKSTRDKRKRTADATPAAR
jgi:non-specific protein-tyrosine kinase